MSKYIHNIVLIASASFG